MRRAVRFDSVLLAGMACATGCSFLAAGKLDKASSETGQVEGGAEVDQGAPDAPADEGAAPSGSSSGSSGSSSGSLPEAAPYDGGPLSCATALTVLGQCMVYTDFIANSGGYAASDVATAQTATDGNCTACHDTGAGGFYADPEPTVMFQATQQLPYIRAWVDCTVDNQGNFHGFLPSTAIVDQGAGCDASATPCHALYQLPAGLVSAMDTFVMTSVARFNSGTCAPPPDGGMD
jgi:hypothetical protein